MSVRKSPSHHQSAQFVAQPALFIGVDVAKEELVIACGDQVLPVINAKKPVRAWLKGLPAGCHIALESTGRFHLTLSNLAHENGHTVYLLNPQEIKHYRCATRRRAKTDECDAQLIARYIEKEHAQLRPYKPLTPVQLRLSGLLRRRAAMVKAHTSLRLSFADDAKFLGVDNLYKKVLEANQELLDELAEQIKQLLVQCADCEAAARLLTIKGIGPLTCAALLLALQRGEFPTADAFVAFLGLDPVPKDSGNSQGRRRISKKGDSETRRLLYNAALSASQTTAWKPIYQRYLDRGMAHIKALCIIARKLARTAWSIYKHGTTFKPDRLTNPEKPAAALT